MSPWNEERYEEEKRAFIRARAAGGPLLVQFSVLFAATWGAAWACSALLLHLFGPAHPWARLLPMRYAIVFIFAYACFFLAVRVWIKVARKLPHRSYDRSDSDWDWGYTDLDFSSDDGCMYVILILVVVLIAGFLLSGLFLAIGGAPLLLEVAFEAVFAGVVVARPFKGNFVVGDWKGRLLANTWKPALVTFVVLVSLASYLHSKAPQATTFAQAVGTLVNDHGQAP